MTTNSLKDEAKDEIDLIDLLIVLIKYRFLILGSLTLFILVTLAGYLIYPSWKFSMSSIVETSEAICRVVAGPAMKSVKADYDLTLLFQSAPSFLDALNKAGYESLGRIDLSDMEERELALSWLEENYPLEIIDEYNDQKPEIEKFKTQIIKISYINSEPDRAEQFLNILFDIINNKVLETLKPQLLNVVDGYEQLLSIESPSDSQKQALVEGYPVYHAAQRALENKSDALILYEKPYSIVKRERISIDQIKSEYKKISVMLVFAVLFLSIFLAFILQFINSVRQDEESMEKIRKALGKEFS